MITDDSCYDNLVIITAHRVKLYQEYFQGKNLSLVFNYFYMRLMFVFQTKAIYKRRYYLY